LVPKLIWSKDGYPVANVGNWHRICCWLYGWRHLSSKRRYYFL